MRNPAFRIPFRSTSTRLEYEVVTDKQGQSMYFVKVGDLRINEDVSRIDEMVKIQARLTAHYLRALKTYQAEYGCSLEDAEAYFSKGGSKAGGSLYDYMTTDDVAEFQELSAQTDGLDKHVTTVFIQNRLLYPLFVTQDASAGATTIYCEPCTYDVNAGDVFRIDGHRVTVTSPPEDGANFLSVKPLTAPIAADSLGFQMDGRSEKQGMPLWTIEMTEQYISLGIQEEIMKFHGRERSGVLPPPEAVEPTEILMEGNDPSMMKSISGSPTPDNLQLTGEASTGDSSQLETQGSRKKHLAVSPAG